MTIALSLLDDPYGARAAAKGTRSIVVAPPSKRRLPPIAPGAEAALARIAAVLLPAADPLDGHAAP